VCERVLKKEKGDENRIRGVEGGEERWGWERRSYRATINKKIRN